VAETARRILSDVNLVGHVAVAVHHSPDATPGFLVGAMLPDLAAMARVRLTHAEGEVGDGVAFHHASDTAFHASRWFNHHNQALRDALLAVGVDRGASRACAHAGLEMLLDGRLLAAGLVVRGTEIAFAALAVDGPTLEAVCALVPPAAVSTWRARLQMIGRSIDRDAYTSGDEVAARLHRMTRGRTRIELRAEQVDAVARELDAYRPRVARDATSVLADVVLEVDTSRPIVGDRA
jgi:hypothetical protein